MDELGKLSPASRERNLDDLPRKELQQLAKEAGVKVLACQTLLLHTQTCAQLNTWLSTGQHKKQGDCPQPVEMPGRWRSSSWNDCKSSADCLYSGTGTS